MFFFIKLLLTPPPADPKSFGAAKKIWCPGPPLVAMKKFGAAKKIWRCRGWFVFSEVFEEC
jgi:hypothetical protein